MLEKFSKKKLIFDLLAKRKFFKLDLNKFEEKDNFIRNLTTTFTLSGCTAFDINQDPKNISLIQESIDLAVHNSHDLGFVLPYKPLIISSFKGLSIKKKDQFLMDSFNKAINLGVDILELDITENSIDEAYLFLNTVSKLSIDYILSLSISRKKLSNASIIEVIKYAKNINKNLIVEVDGLYNYDYENDYNATLQVLSTTDIIYKQLIEKEIKFRRLPILISGGTNINTKQFATQCGVNYNGITFGKYIKKIINMKNYQKKINFSKALTTDVINIRDFINSYFN